VHKGTFRSNPTLPCVGIGRWSKDWLKNLSRLLGCQLKNESANSRNDEGTG
jgi:hypothetical protein